MYKINEVSTIFTLQDSAPSLKEIRTWLDEICHGIAVKYGLVTPNGNPRKAFVLDALLGHACRGCIDKILSHPENNGRADALYVQNHDLAVGLLVECLRQTFEAQGFNFQVGQEENGVFGRPDIVVKPTASGVIVTLDDFEVVIEVKTGKSFAYSQIIRYWLERPKAIHIIWRITCDQVLVIDPDRHHAILELCLLAAIRRGLDILNGRVEACNHNPTRSAKRDAIDAQNILDSYFQSLQKSLPKVLSVIQERVWEHLTNRPLDRGLAVCQ